MELRSGVCGTEAYNGHVGCGEYAEQQNMGLRPANVYFLISESSPLFWRLKSIDHGGMAKFV